MHEIDDLEIETGSLASRFIAFKKCNKRGATLAQSPLFTQILPPLPCSPRPLEMIFHDHNPLWKDDLRNCRPFTAPAFVAML